MRAFEQADIFLCEDTRETKRLLKLLGERFDMRYRDAEFVSFHEHNGAQRLEELSDVLDERNIVYVSDAGMPAISDPGQLLVVYAQQHNIAYDVFPGPTAVVTAYAASGFESGEFVFFGFLPHKGKERQAKLDEVIGCGYDAVLYESPHRLEKLLDELVCINPDREIFAAKELTKKYQHYYHGSADKVRRDITTGTIRGEWVIVISGEKSDSKSLSFEEVLRLELPPKPKAKLLAQLSDKSVKEWYDQLSKK
jgi:16S rRNA (cytidine1402-2'-O)-methyltransferase